MAKEMQGSYKAGKFTPYKSRDSYDAEIATKDNKAVLLAANGKVLHGVYVDGAFIPSDISGKGYTSHLKTNKGVYRLDYLGEMYDSKNMLAGKIEDNGKIIGIEKYRARIEKELSNLTKSWSKKEHPIQKNIYNMLAKNENQIKESVLMRAKMAGIDEDKITKYIGRLSKYESSIMHQSPKEDYKGLLKKLMALFAVVSFALSLSFASPNFTGKEIAIAANLASSNILGIIFFLAAIVLLYLSKNK